MGLLEFLSYLHGKGLIDATRINDYDDISDLGFHGSLRAYKYVFLARYFGLDLGYRFDGMLFGPYSRAMTADCKKMDFENMAPASAPPGLREDEFLAMAAKGNDWVDAVAIVMHQKESEGDLTPLHLKNALSGREPEFIRSVSDYVDGLVLAPAQAA